jgi:formate dehydrogenase maturation protein FdhE
MDDAIVTNARNLPCGEIVRRLQRLMGQPAVADEYLRLRIALVKIQHIALEVLEDSPLQPLPPPQGVHGLRTPILRPLDIGFDTAIAFRLFDDICRECRRHGQPGADLGTLESAVRDRPSLLKGFVRYAACRADASYPATLARRLGLSESLLLLVGRLVAAPFWVHAARRLREERFRLQPSRGPCPMCGATPGQAAILPDDGRRALYCSLCGEDWHLDRLVCPFCEQASPTGLGRLMVEGEDARWIETCAACRHFLRVTDVRHATVEPPLVPLAEDVAGTGLEFVAEREGLGRKPPYAAPW